MDSRETGHVQVFRIKKAHMSHAVGSQRADRQKFYKVGPTARL